MDYREKKSKYRTDARPGCDVDVLPTSPHNVPFSLFNTVYIGIVTHTMLIYYSAVVFDLGTIEHIVDWSLTLTNIYLFGDYS